MSVTGEFKFCPFCKEQIRKEAVKCRFCGEWLEQNESGSQPKPPQVEVIKSSSHADTKDVINQPILEPQPQKVKEQSKEVNLDKNLFPNKSEPKITSVAKREISVKTLYWISAALLLFCILVLIISLSIIPWSHLSADRQGVLTEKLSGVIVRILVCAGLLAWSVKRKGYRLLTFSIVCSIATLIYAYYFGAGKNQAEQQAHVSNAKLDENVQEIYSNEVSFAAQGAQGSVTNIINPTGDDENDAILLWANNLSQAMTQYVGSMSKELSALEQDDVFDTLLLTNKSRLQLEIPKRLKYEQIVNKYKEGWMPMLEATKTTFNTANVSEKVKTQILRGAETSFQKNSAQADILLGLFLKTNQAELNYLQFLLGTYDGYQLKNGKISFVVGADSQKYKGLVKDIQEANRNEATFREQYAKSAEDSMQQLHEELKK